MTRITVCRDSLTQSNCYLIGEKGRAVVIDPNHFELVENALREQALTPELVMLSHEHCDHIQGLQSGNRRYHPEYVPDDGSLSALPYAAERCIQSFYLQACGTGI